MKYPPNIYPIRINCSGRVDPALVLKALASGADGVLIAGCHPGDCHYTSGNVKTLRRFKLLQNMLDQFGIERQRVRLEWVSASEGERYARVVKSMTEDIRSLGPLDWKSKVEVAA
jgi:F420-non-reducing hydrogenase iron-sulfur subunit